MLEMNKVMLIGNLTRDPEGKTTQSGMELAKFGIAVNRSWKDKQSDEWKEETTFVEIDVWGKTAVFVMKYFRKGLRVYIEGSLRFNEWEADDGSKRNKLSVTAQKVKFALPKAENKAQQAPAPASIPGQAPPPPDNSADDLPF